jgi:cytochrome c peroxidase
MKANVSRFTAACAVLVLVLAGAITTMTAQQPGAVLTTPIGPMELPIEVEIELSPAGSLKQAALWKELYQLLKNPYDISCPPDDPATPLENESYYCTATIPRREGFGAVLPPLRIYSPGYNFLTAQPLRRRTSDGEVSWDQPGPMFDPNQDVAPSIYNEPTILRSPIGHIVACPNPGDNGLAYQAAAIPANFCEGIDDGSLVVYNPSDNGLIPANGTVVATAAYVGGQLLDEDGVPIDELEAPVNEEDFFRDPADTQGVPAPLRAYIGRLGAETLGKALFWDMQVGSDGVQACGSCHFHAGADNRTKGQLNPNINGPLGNLAPLSVQPANTDVVANNFPFHSGAQDQTAVDDSDDVMSSMGVSRSKTFVDIPPIGRFLASGALPPDIGTLDALDPVPVNHGFRRVEPRNTPTMISAAFNFDNFWDGRARFIYNGGSVFGASDPTAHIFWDLTPGAGGLAGAIMSDIRPDLVTEAPEVAGQPVRIKFSSQASQSNGPPLSDFEMSFRGRNWAKIGKKLLQAGVKPLANQLVATDDSRLGPFSNQGGSVCTALGRPTAVNTPGLCVSYVELIEASFRRELWQSSNQRLNGAACADPFDGYCLTVGMGAAAAANRNQFRQREANFSLFFGLSVQAYETLLIPDQTPADNFFDANPFAGGGVGEPGDQAVLFPTLIRDIIGDGKLNGEGAADVALVAGFGADEVFGFDLFAGANLTAALAPAQSVGASGRDRNPERTNSIGQTIRVGSNPFTRSAKCMLCHLGPEQTDHSINISHGLLKNDAEFEFPVPPAVPDPTSPATFADGVLPAPEPSGSSRTVVGLILEEEVGEGVAQDAVETEPRDFQVFDDLATPWDDRIVAQESNFAFGDQGVYNIGVRPSADDIGRGNNDPFGWPLSLAALTLKNIGGVDFEPCDASTGGGVLGAPNTNPCVMANFDPANIGATFDVTGADQSINPGFERDPADPQMPEYMIPWIHSLPAGELHPQIDEMAGMVPNTITAPNGGPGIEFPEIIFGADFHCALYSPATFGFGPPNFGWGPPTSTDNLCPQTQSGVAGNFPFPSQGTWPVPNRVMRDGAFKAPPLRNVELTGPFFHTGSFLTLRQVVDFYFEGGDFPVTNKESRDPHVVNLEMQAFAFGPTQVLIDGVNVLFTLFDCTGGLDDPAIANVSCGDTFNYLVGTFGDGLPDTAFLYDEYPDSDHPITPEPTFASREEALEDAKNSIVKFLLALTDPRVKNEQAPFDKPELFVPIDGRAPENVGGRVDLIAQSGVACASPLMGGPAVDGGPDVVLTDGGNPGPVCFRQIPATGATGLPGLGLPPLVGFLGVTNLPLDAGGQCSASAGPVSHFCSTITF